MNSRYQTPSMDHIWSELRRNQIERQVWIDVMQAQQTIGLGIDPEVVEAYGLVARELADNPDTWNELAQIAEIEKHTRHDLYARLQFFNQAAKQQAAHLGLTSADIVENTQQLQILASSEQLMEHAEQLALRLVKIAHEHARTATVARTHGRPAQLTTLGKRAADWLHELLSAMIATHSAQNDYAMRGIKGAVGTRTDMAQTLQPADPGHDPAWVHAAAAQLDSIVTSNFTDGPAGHQLFSVGQCYPRGYDLPLTSAALQLAAACNTICINVRLMAMLGLAQEAPKPDQVGSSAMPHKINPRYSERVASLLVVARGYQHMLQELAGAQWFEGDVSSSAARRVALPGLFHTVDAILANTAHVLDRLRFNQEQICQDVARWLPFLASGRILAAAVAAGADRTEAHRTIQHHARRAMNTTDPARIFIDRIATDPLLPVNRHQIDVLMDVADMTRTAIVTALDAVADDMQDQLAQFDMQWPGELL